MASQINNQSLSNLSHELSHETTIVASTAATPTVETQTTTVLDRLSLPPTLNREEGGAELQDRMSVLSLDTPVDLLPDEVLLQILGLLPLKSLGQASLVCKRWASLCEDDTFKTFWSDIQRLKEIYPTLAIYDRIDWKKNFGLRRCKITCDDAKPLNKERMVRIITELKPLFALSIEGDAGISLIKLPNNTNFAMLLTLIAEKNPEGKPTTFNGLGESFKNAVEKVVKKTHFVAVTNSVVKGTPALSAEDFWDRYHALREKGYEFPEAISLGALLAFICCTADRTLPNRCYGADIRTNVLEEANIGTTDRISHLSMGDFTFPRADLGIYYTAEMDGVGFGLQKSFEDL